MQNYKRKISYFYQYHNGMVGSTAGFLKMEIRGDKVKMIINIQDPSGIQNREASLYLYHEAGEKLIAVKVDMVPNLDGVLTYQKKTDWMNVFDTGRDLYTFDGVVVVYHAAQYFIGDFQDRNRKNYELVMQEPEHPEKQETVTVRETTEADRVREIAGRYRNPETDRMREIAGRYRNLEPDQMRENTGGDRNPEADQMREIAGSDRNSETDQMRESTVGDRNPQMEDPVQVQKEKEKSQDGQAATEETVSKESRRTKERPARNVKPGQSEKDTFAGEQERPEEKNETGQAENGRNMTGEKKESAGKPEGYVEKTCEQRITGKQRQCEKCPYYQKQTAEKENGDAFETMLREYPRLQMYNASELFDCVRIVPRDIGRLDMRNWKLGVNSFLTHGYYSYHYLLLGRMRFDDGSSRSIIGVPGVFSNREKYLANMFGFDQFIPVKKTGVKTGEFGYWIVEISPYL